MADIKQITTAPNQPARLTRNVMRWRSPVFGYIDMYLNPQNISITDSKVSTSTRTKAGFVYQYAGENLTKISISGTTGSAGIEGVNILEAIYRSEQIGFENIALQLEQELAVASVSNTVSSGLNSILNNIPGLSSIPLIGASLDYASQPFPSLAALATAIEMEFQGVLYRGYFESFNVSESAQEVGLFSYNIEFTAYAKQGLRTNFMPWHRSPQLPLDSSSKDNFSIGATVSDPAFAASNAQPVAAPTDNNAQSGRTGRISRALGPASLDLTTLFNT